jgi:hypothetical protein
MRRRHEPIPEQGKSLAHVVHGYFMYHAADQLGVTQRVPPPCPTPMGTRASAPQPEGQVRMGADGKAGRRLASETAHPSSLAPTALRRQTLKVGAVCGKAARTGGPYREHPRKPPTQLNSSSSYDGGKHRWLESGFLPAADYRRVISRRYVP